MSKNPNPQHSESMPFTISKKTDWPQKVLTDSEIKDFDENGLFIICAICPPTSNGCPKTIKTREGCPFDLTRWKSHCETIQHKEARKQKACGKGPGIKSFFIPKSQLQLSSKNTQSKHNNQKRKPKKKYM